MVGGAGGAVRSLEREKMDGHAMGVEMMRGYLLTRSSPEVLDLIGIE